MSIPLEFLTDLPAPAPDVSLGEQLAEAVTDSGRISTLLDCLCHTDAPALWSPDTTRAALTHAALRRFVSSFALPTSGLRPQLGPNDRVMVVLPTGPENAVALLAVAAFHTCAPVNAACTAGELAEDAARLGAKAVLTTYDAIERLELVQLREKLGCEVVFLHGREDGPAGLFDVSVMSEGADDDEWGIIQKPHLPPPSTLHGLFDQSLVLHTSGTSGKKKVVPYTLRSLIVGTCAVIHSWDLRDDDVNMNMMPLFHVGGIIRNLWAPMFSGGSAIMCAGFDSNTFWPIIMSLGATWYYAAPTMHHAILGSKPATVTPCRDTRMRMIANAAGGLLPSLATQLKNTFGAVILPSYGMTECMPIASPPTTYQLDRPGCSGLACGPHLSIRHPENIERELPCGSTGAVCVRGIPTFDGYETSPGAPLDTSAFSSEGWFDSGDCGYVDPDGYLFITGRSKEIINKGGEVISPFEIEEAITTVAKSRVKATIAFSVQHDVLQETIGVVIVPVPGLPRIGLTDLLDLLKTQLHPSKWPFAVVYMDDLPKNSAGKPLRIKLAERLNIGQLTDSVPALARHFVAEVPDKNAPLSTPIRCSKVSVEAPEIERTLSHIAGVLEASVRLRKDGSPEALVSIDPSASAASLSELVHTVLPGYAIPKPFHIVRDRFLRTSEGKVDWLLMEAELAQRTAFELSPTAKTVRRIFADLLVLQESAVTGGSDFFLIGGNSLLLGRLAHLVRKETGVALRVQDVFAHPTVDGIAALVDAVGTKSNVESPDKTAVNTPFSGSKASSTKTAQSVLDLPALAYKGTYSDVRPASRGQNHPLSLLVQAIPIMFFYPLKVAFTWTGIVFILSFFTEFITGVFWERLGSLLTAIIAARLAARIFIPLVGIGFKWVVIGRYRPGTYRFWSVYHLRWWLTNQMLRVSGRGIFASHPFLEVLYYRMLGAKIGRDVVIDSRARLGECDLLTLHDGCRIDNALVRGFCVERDGCFRLDPIVVGRGATVNTYTQLAPGAVIPDGATYGPHASSHDDPSPDRHAQYNRAALPQPKWYLKAFVAGPLVLLVKLAAHLPWFAALFVLLSQPAPKGNLDALERVIVWFSSPRRVAWHAVARVVRGVCTPLLQVLIGILVKRAMGFQTERSTAHSSQWVLLRRYINMALLSQESLKRAFDILGTHYEATSVVWRWMGAKVGQRVYWPGSGLYCPDPELLEVGDDVVFGSRSEIFTTDGLGSGRIVVRDGAMVADRVVLLPCVTVGKRTVMGSGALARRGASYEDGSVWMGSERGEAVCFKPGSKEARTDSTPTITPFGRAFYERSASFYVLPYPLLFHINIAVVILTTGYWSIGPVVGTQVLNLLRIHLRELHLFAPGPQQPFILFGLISCWFTVTLSLQALVALLWVVGTKWLVIGRRVPGSCDWDKSSYCQRWQLHLTLARPLYRGYGNGGVLGALSGSAYAVWYVRALGARVGRDCALWASGRVGLMTEPDLVELGDRVALDDCSVVAHLNSRGKFSLNKLSIASGCAMRSGARLLSGASMEAESMLLEHTLLTSGEIAQAGEVYGGWPARSLDPDLYLRRLSAVQLMSALRVSAHYTKLQMAHHELEGEKRRLEQRITDHQRDLREARRRLESMLQAVETLRSPPPVSPV
ncbi:acetyl-CoA synthetase-like protein [Epithele typhae]|uniref:acetyl-CoA synthetase-like protein n=1 Tax=Epithele typhae TaxID=378194 RepID=UPI0020075209|nr:acetyl-CoA synthetase-like protein [Epithele typhae]KAH9945157.1 acetyl-CoA synthetase-like protein [Epithele typhae]